MELTKPDKKQVCEEFLQIINYCENSARIRGTLFSQEKNDRYNKVALLCIHLFKSAPTNARIIVDEVTKCMPFASVTAHMDTFELNPTNKPDFLELTNLADTITFYGDEEDQFHMTFTVNGIWSE